MNKVQFIVALLMLSVVANVQAQGFKKISEKAIDIAVSPKDGTVYVIGTSKSVFKYNKSKKKFEKYIHATRAKRLSVDQYGTVYCANSLQKVYVSDKGKWKGIPGLKSNDVDAVFYTRPKAGTVAFKGFYTADQSNTTHKVTLQGDWKKRVIVGKDVSERIADSRSSLWTISKGNVIRRRVGTKWKDMPGRAIDIAVDDKHDKVYVVNTKNKILSWSTVQNKWIHLPGTRSDVVNISVHDGIVWCTTKDNSIYYYDKTAPGNSNVVDYAGRYRVTVTYLYTNTPNNLFNTDAAIYGTVGIRLSGKGKSGSVEIDALGNKQPRIWNVSRSNPQHIKGGDRGNLKSVNSGKIRYYGSYEIGKSRDYQIKGELANHNLKVNVQMNLNKKDIIDEKFGWKQLNLMVKDIQFGKTYYLENKKKDRHLTLGVVVEKI